MKVGVLTALGIAIHNFPEGFATFAGALYSLELGILLAIAIATHNLVGAFFLLPFLTDYILHSILAFIAGIMVYVSLDELFPSAYGNTKGHLAALGIILGIVVMSISLILLR